MKFQNKPEKRKTIFLTPKDERNLFAVMRAEDCRSQIEGVRAALRIAVQTINGVDPE
ncbi:MAG: hypothetical protein V1494_00570 [Candidatus Diapherotrites archaeon]